MVLDETLIISQKYKMLKHSIFLVLLGILFLIPLPIIMFVDKYPHRPSEIYTNLIINTTQYKDTLFIMKYYGIKIKKNSNYPDYIFCHGYLKSNKQLCYLLLDNKNYFKKVVYWNIDFYRGMSLTNASKIVVAIAPVWRNGYYNFVHIRTSKIYNKWEDGILIESIFVISFPIFGIIMLIYSFFQFKELKK